MSPPARFLALTGIVFGATATVLFLSGTVDPVSVSFRLPTPPTPAPQAILPPATAIATAADSADEPDVSPPRPPLDLSRVIPIWERQIELTATDPAKSATERARAVLMLLPALPEEALAAAAERAVDALPDADYAAVALPVVSNPLTHNRAMSVLFSDLMERPDPTAMPALLQIARNPAHAFAPVAKDNLQLLLGADFGTDWSRWDAEIQRVIASEKR